MGFLDSKIKTIGNRQVLEMPNSVNFVIMTKDYKILLAEQFRASVGEKTLNLFGGYADNNETLNITLVRELKEETNLDLEDISDIIMVYENKHVSMGYTTEKNSLYIIKLNSQYEKIKDKLKCNDIDENINIKCFDFDYIKVLDNRINSCKFTALVMFIKSYFMDRDLINDYICRKLETFINNNVDDSIHFTFSKVDIIYEFFELRGYVVDYDNAEYDGMNVYVPTMQQNNVYYDIFNDGTTMSVTRVFV